MRKTEKILFIISGVFLVLAIIAGTGSSWSNVGQKVIDVLFMPKAERNLAGLEPAIADNIYPMFFCPCCGQPLDKKNICCPMAQERIDYIDSLTEQKLSEKEIILAYVKKYGMNSFVDKRRQEEIRDELIKLAPAERPIISFSSNFYDLGDVSQKNGIAITIFELKNVGTQNLLINKLNSSCGCTSASIVFNGVEGPRFAMAGHGIESPTNWQISLAPGETAQLKVYYDPNVHKDFRGAATREIYIFSNDPIDSEKKVTIELNQVN